MAPTRPPGANYNNSTGERERANTHAPANLVAAFYSPKKEKNALEVWEAESEWVEEREVV